MRALLFAIFLVLSFDHAAAQDRPDVTRLTADELQAKRRGASALIVLDVRGANEYAISHLEGSVRVGPEVDAAQIRRLLRGKLRGATVVFYCTAGVRSEAIAQKSEPLLRAAGARSVASLSDGIIGWSNAGLPLVDRNGRTQLVHTFDQQTARLLFEPSRARFEPR